MISADVIFFESKPYYLSVVESVDHDHVCFLLRLLSSSSESPSSQEDLEPLPSTQDKSIQVYKRRGAECIQDSTHVPVPSAALIRCSTW